MAARNGIRFALVATAVALTVANRNTVKDHLRRLTKAGHLSGHGTGRGAWYALS